MPLKTRTVRREIGVRIPLTLALGIACVYVSGFVPVWGQPYGWEEAAEESYWYSLYNAEALAGSGLGVREDGLLIWPYAAGLPLYVQTQSTKWTERNLDRRVTTEAVAWTATAWLAHAKQLDRLHDRGIAAQKDALLAIDFGIRAAKALRRAHTQLRDPLTQLYRAEPTASEFLPQDQAAMLQALSELITIAEGFPLYRGEVSRSEAARRAEELLRAVWAYMEENPDWLSSLYEKASLVEAVAAVGAALEDEDRGLLSEVASWIYEQSRGLARELIRSPEAPTRDQAEGVRALLVAYRVTGDPALREDALTIWERLQERWDGRVNVYRLTDDPNAPGAYEYTLRDVGALVGAFGAVIYEAGLADAPERFVPFFQAVVKRSRLMIAEGPEAGGDLDDDAVPSPQEAGGEYGRPPVFASKVRYDFNDATWYVTNSLFRAGGAMHLAVRLLELGTREGQPYLGPPRYGLPESAQAQLIVLQELVAELRARQVPREEVDALKVLLSQVESRVRGLSAQATAVEPLTRRLSELQKRVDELEQQLIRLQSERTERVRAEVSRRDTLIVIGIVAVLLLGFVLYQWAVSSLQRRKAA